jgi:maleylpyruvate isomerase
VDLLSDLHDATHRLVRAVDELDDAAYAEPSRLPGWTRGHVVAHLALNAEALTGALRGVLAGEPVPMYASDAARDDDIDDLAPASPTVLRDRLYAATTSLAEALTALPAERVDAVVERTPGSERTFAAGEVAAMRLHEVEFHHADLGTGYTAGDWAPGFAAVVVERLHGRAPATLVASDFGRSWQADPGAPTVTGTAADLAWWLSGRGEGGGLTSDGELPGIEAW